MEDYRRTKYCDPFDGIQERKEKVKQLKLPTHKVGVVPCKMYPIVWTR